MSDPNQKHESGLSEMARKALDSILGRGKDDNSDSSDSSKKDSGSASIGKKESSGGDIGLDVLSAGATGAANSISSSTSQPTGDADRGIGMGTPAGSYGGGSSSGTLDAASAGLGSASSSIGGSPYDTNQAGSDSSSGEVEEEFVGSGGVGSAEFMEALRKGHEAAGGEYTSDLSDPNKRGGPTEV